MAKPPAPLSADSVVELAETFSLLGEPNRLRIVLAAANGGANVGDLARGLGLSPSLVSHHLRLLRAARLVRGERHGKHVFYLPDDSHILEMIAAMAEHVSEADHGADADRAQPTAQPTARPRTSTGVRRRPRRKAAGERAFR